MFRNGNQFSLDTFQNVSGVFAAVKTLIHSFNELKRSYEKASRLNSVLDHEDPKVRYVTYHQTKKK